MAAALFVTSSRTKREKVASMHAFAMCTLQIKKPNTFYNANSRSNTSCEPRPDQHAFKYKIIYLILIYNIT